MALESVPTTDGMVEKPTRRSRRITTGRLRHQQQRQQQQEELASTPPQPTPRRLTPSMGPTYLHHSLSLSIQSARDICTRRYGITCDQNKNKYANLRTHLLTTPYNHLTNDWPRNLKVHNLCDDPLSVPPRLLKVLGLGLGYCVSLKRDPNINPIDIPRLIQDIRTKCMLGNDSDPDFDRKLHVKRPDWKPDHAPDELEQALTQFVNAANAAFKRSRALPHISNLAPTDLQSLRNIPKERKYCVVDTDKNLGPCIMEMDLMIRRSLHDHLLDTSSYEECSESEALARNEQNFRTIVRTMVDDRANLDAPTIKYFTRTLCTNRDGSKCVQIPTHLHLPYFYIAPKVHKKPWKTRPVVSAVASVPEALSRWIDVQLQKVIHLCPAHLTDSWQLLRDIKNIPILPPDVHIFTADAVSMYTNINTTHALDTFTRWFDLHHTDLPQEFPVNKILAGLDLIMNSNVFSFGNRYFLQTNGTAMGTPCACAYATIYYSYHEEMVLLKDPSLLFYRRLIDDAIVIQRSQPHSHETFMSSMDNFGPPGKRLKWESEAGPQRSVHFLDLHLDLQDNGTIHTRTYQKDMNLYLYRPPSSAQPKSILYGLIYGTLHRYHWQNTDPQWFNHYVMAFYRRLLDRGHKPATLSRLFTTATDRVRRSTIPLPKSKSKQLDEHKNTIFLHLPYHNQDPPRQIIQKIFHDICRPALNDAHIPNGVNAGCPVTFGRTIVAYSRAPNIASLAQRNRLLPEIDTHVPGPP